MLTGPLLFRCGPELSPKAADRRGDQIDLTRKIEQSIKIGVDWVAYVDCTISFSNSTDLSLQNQSFTTEWREDKIDNNLEDKMKHQNRSLLGC